MSAGLIIGGAVIVALLGTGHAVFTLQSKPTHGPMMPTNPAVAEAMQIQGGLGLAPELNISLFRAWIGFNLSHSFGVIAIAAVLLYHAIVDVDAALESLWFVFFAVASPAIYLLLAVTYWFDKPRNAIALASLLIWAGVIVGI